MRLDRQLLDIVPYNVYSGLLPEPLDQGTQGYVELLSKTIHRDTPQSVTTIVVITPTGPQTRREPPESLNLYVFGKFRKHYSAMKQTAEALSILYSEIQILPLISPVLTKEWRSQERLQGPVYERIRKLGIIAYSVEVPPSNWRRSGIWT